MSKAEDFAYEYIKAVQNSDSRVVREFMRGRSTGFRESIIRTLKTWDCYQDVPIRLLHVEPKPPRDFAEMTVAELASLAERQPRLRGLIELHLTTREES